MSQHRGPGTKRTAAAVAHTDTGMAGEARPSSAAGHWTPPAGLAVDATHLYWANNGDGTINQANLDVPVATPDHPGPTLAHGQGADTI
jgi:hypothetical protein